MLLAPFSDDQVLAINLNQTHTAAGILVAGIPCPHSANLLHPGPGAVDDLLIATHDGLICPFCTYSREWIDAGMTRISHYGKKGLDRVSRSIAQRAFGPAIETYTLLVEQNKRGAALMLECLSEQQRNLKPK